MMVVLEPLKMVMAAAEAAVAVEHPAVLVEPKVKIIPMGVELDLVEQVQGILLKLLYWVLDGYMMGMDMDILNIRDILQPK